MSLAMLISIICTQSIAMEHNANDDNTILYLPGNLTPDSFFEKEKLKSNLILKDFVTIKDNTLYWVCPVSGCLCYSRTLDRIRTHWQETHNGLRLTEHPYYMLRYPVSNPRRKYYNYDNY